MVKKYFFLSAFFVALLSTSITGSTVSFAQPGRDGGSDLQTDFILLTSFIHNSSISEADFIMRVSKFGVISGCAHVEDTTKRKNKKMKLGVSTKYISDRFEATVSMPKIALSDEDPRYEEECAINHNETYVDVEMNRDELIERGVKKIALKSEELDYGSYEVDVNEDRLILKAIDFSTGGEGWQTLWFFPSNTVKLSIPSTKNGKNVTEQIKTFGLSRGLVPMDEVLEGYEHPTIAENYMYFVDPKEIITRHLTPENNLFNAGQVSIPKTYYGSEGAKEIYEKIDVIANLPLTRIISEY